MHRLQAVARVRERTRHDHAHRVIEVGALHLIEDRDGTNIGRSGGLAGLLIFSVRQREIRSVSHAKIASNHIAHRSAPNHPSRPLQSAFSLRFSSDLYGEMECQSAPDHSHQADPDPADRRTLQGALRSFELHETGRHGRHRRECMQRNCQSSVEQGARLGAQGSWPFEQRLFHRAVITTRVGEPSPPGLCHCLAGPPYGGRADQTGKVQEGLSTVWGNV